MNSSVPSGPDASRGLPPVLPPSGRFIAQLFVVPGLIVFGVVALVMLFSLLAKSGYTAEQFLQRIDSNNADLRWRAASELADVLMRSEDASLQLKTDPVFALDLADRLRTALEELSEKEEALAKKIASLPSEQHDKAWEALAPQRDHALFLASALKEFYVPVGVPILCELSLKDSSPDVRANTLRRRQALWSLARLGENMKSFAKLPPVEQGAILAKLAEEANPNTSRAQAARTALVYLAPGSIKPGAEGTTSVEAALARVADAEDRYLREQAAMAFRFWPGPLAEATLLKLAHDDGHGTMLRVHGLED